MKDFLINYFNVSEINGAVVQLLNRKRIYLKNDKYFAKLCLKTEDNNFENLKLEINLYLENNQVFNNIYINSLIAEEFCILVLKKLDAMPLSSYRNNFDIKITKNTRIKICHQINNIKDLQISNNRLKRISRLEMFDKYFVNAQKYLDSKLIKDLSVYRDKICEQSSFVISHGDLILSNILVNKSVNFIDWEYLALRSSTYDLAYFLLFSKRNRCLRIFKDDEKYLDICRDGIIICLKEVCKWHKLYNKIADNIFNDNINRWLYELEYIVKEMKKYETIDNCTTV